MIIDSVTVDIVDLYGLGTETEGFSIHFNCFGKDGTSLPGLGGYLRRATVANNAAQDKQACELVDYIKALGIGWVRRFDEWSDADTPITLIGVQTKLYGPPGAMGINLEFRRGDDPIVASQLFTIGGGITMHNYKRAITDSQTIADIKDDVLEIVARSEALALAVNKTRNIRRRGDELATSSNEF